ncbi:uncharacterized protein LOC132296337 [Cornus florida]|uniref:uncharacterized protein LOC132296337 n=1 Tax=Cornus florida TaxID=4283 RepID=UPI00289CDA7F|nr:uncharacterized protein LOC132296337 [Cornus florida]
MNYRPSSQIVLEEMVGTSDIPPVDTPNINTENDETQEIPVELPSSSTSIPAPVLRRSGRTIIQPEKLTLLGEVYEAVPDKHESDLVSYAEALTDIDANRWKDAMRSELESMYTNKVWDIIELPSGVQPIDYPDARRSTSGYVFKFNGRAVSWKSVKQGCTADSTMEAEYIAGSEAAKEAVWLRNFLIELEACSIIGNGFI